MLRPHQQLESSRQHYRNPNLRFSKRPLKPGQTIKTFIGRFNEFENKTTIASIICVGANKKNYEFSNKIDLNSYLSLVTLGEDPAESVAKSLKSISETLEGMARGNRRMAVDIHTRHDRDFERRQYEDSREEFRRKSDEGSVTDQ